MRAIFVQLSSLLGLIVFLTHLWRSTDIGRTVFVAVGTGLAIYIVLVLSYIAVRSIVRHTPTDKSPTHQASATPKAKQPKANQPKDEQAKPELAEAAGS